MSGFLRGSSLSANDLIYIAGLGTFQLDKIEQHQFQRNVRSFVFDNFVLFQFKDLVFSRMELLKQLLRKISFQMKINVH